MVRKGVSGRPALVRKVFSRMRCCVVCSTSPLGRTGANCAAASAVGAGDIFELEGDDADSGGKFADSIQIVVGSDDFQVRYLTGGRIGIGGKCVYAVSHAAGGDREHAAKLPTSQDAYGCAPEEQASCQSILQHFRGLLFTEGEKFLAQFGARISEDADGQ